jgi:hypothetical protein
VIRWILCSDSTCRWKATGLRHASMARLNKNTSRGIPSTLTARRNRLLTTRADRYRGGFQGHRAGQR